MFKNNAHAIENDKYEMKREDTFYLKRTQKCNGEKSYFCVMKSEIAPLELLAQDIKKSKNVRGRLGKENVRGSLLDVGNGLYQATIVYFDDTLKGLKEATQGLELVKSEAVLNQVLNNN